MTQITVPNNAPINPPIAPMIAPSIMKIPMMLLLDTPIALKIPISRPRSTTTRMRVVVMLNAAMRMIKAMMNKPMRRSRASAVKSGRLASCQSIVL